MNLDVNVKKVSSTLMVNASSPHHVHASMLVKVTKLVKLSTLNVKTAFVMLIVLSAVLINRARSFDQFSENPHFTSFDNKRFDFQETCSYIFARSTTC